MCLYIILLLCGLYWLVIDQPDGMMTPPVNGLVFITDTESVYRAVRAEYLNIVCAPLWSLKS
jgi:hypothetical protein